MNPPAFLPAWLVVSTLHCSVAILLVALLRVPVRRWLGAQAAHLLWLLVLVQMAAPWLPHNPLGWRPQFVPAIKVEAVTPIVTTHITVSIGDAPLPKRGTGMPAVQVSPLTSVWPTRLWAIGGCTVLTLSLLRAQRAARLVRRAREVTVAELGEVLSGDWSRVKWRVRETSELRSPALCGLWRPVVLLPVDWRVQFTAAELRCVFAHELGHIRRGDLWWRWGFLFATAVHWFNPLVWLAARLAQRDQEMACDEWVFTRRDLAEVQPYGEALLKAVRLLGRPSFHSPMQAGMAESKAGLAARLRRLAHLRSPARFASAIILSLIVLACAVLSPAPQAAEPVLAEASTSEASPVLGKSMEPAASPTPASLPAPPAPAALTTPVARSSDKEQFVEIESKFVEISQNSLKELGFDWFFGIGAPNAAPVSPLPVTTANPSGASASDQNAIDAMLFGKTGNSAPSPSVGTILGLFTDPQFQTVVRALNQKKGVDLLSAPRVTTRSGQKAKIEIIREFNYPTVFEPPKLNGKNQAPATPTKFETRNTGVSLEVLPEVAADGSIDLTLTPSVVEFVGFINYGVGRPARAGGSDALDEMMLPRPVAKTDQVINQPIFETRRITTSGNLRSGQTLLLGGLTREDDQIVEEGAPGHRKQRTEKIQRRLYVFVTARLVDMSGHAKVVVATPPEATPEPKKTAVVPGLSNLPSAIPVPNKPGYFTSPFAPDKGYIDLRGYPSGTEVKCPYSGKMILVP